MSIRSDLRKLIDDAADSDPDEVEALADALGRLLHDHLDKDSKSLDMRRSAVKRVWEFADAHIDTLLAVGDAELADWLRSGAQLTPEDLADETAADDPEPRSEVETVKIIDHPSAHPKQLKPAC